MEPFQILCSIIAITFALYYFFTWPFNFWKSRGVHGPRPIPGFGNLKDVWLGKVSLHDYVTKVYNDYKDESLIGIFAGKTPILIVKDLDLIKNILIKDFPIFADRGFTTHEKAEPLSQHLFNLEPKKWRLLRAKLTPIFTSRKLKEMFLLISKCADDLVDYTEKLVSRNEPIDCLELTTKYMTNVIGNCIFGIEMNALSNEDSEFRRIGRNIFCQPWTDLLRTKIKEFSPRLYDILGYILPQTEITKFFIRFVVDSIDHREKNNIVRHDFIDILRELKKESDKMSEIDFTDSLIASQAFVFFVAGYETSSTAMTNTLYELALNQKVQDTLREEIDHEYTKYGGNLTYDNIKKMYYLDMLFKEILRKYPPTSFMSRKSTSSYTFSTKVGTKVNIPKDQKIWIPLYAIHRDPSIYVEPDVFDPERFNEEVMRNKPPKFYLPFGDGPRNCIASRFAVYQIKLGLIKILRNYKVKPCEKTEIPYVIDDKYIILSPKGGIYLRIINRA